MQVGMRMFHPDERRVIYIAINTIHVIHHEPEPYTNVERIASKSVKVVFKSKYPDLTDSSNIMVVFDDLMRRMSRGLRLEIAIWYVSDQELDTLDEESQIDDLGEFSTKLIILSSVLLIDKPDTTRAGDCCELRGILMNHWDVIKQTFLHGHI